MKPKQLKRRVVDYGICILCVLGLLSSFHILLAGAQPGSMDYEVQRMTGV